MLKKLIVTTLFALTSLGLSSQVSASLISTSLVLETYASGAETPTTIGGYAMTDFGFVDAAGSVSSIVSPLGGSVNFIDGYSNSMDRSSANDNSSWWENGESNNYNIYTTSLHLVTLMLPENTRAFSFNVGADLSNNSGEQLRDTRSGYSGTHDLIKPSFKSSGRNGNFRK